MLLFACSTPRLSRFQPFKDIPTGHIFRTGICHFEFKFLKLTGSVLRCPDGWREIGLTRWFLDRTKCCMQRHRRGNVVCTKLQINSIMACFKTTITTQTTTEKSILSIRSWEYFTYIGVWAFPSSPSLQYAICRIHNKMWRRLDLDQSSTSHRYFRIFVQERSFSRILSFRTRNSSPQFSFPLWLSGWPLAGLVVSGFVTPPSDHFQTPFTLS